MSKIISGVEINNIQIIDDDPDVRESYAYSVEEINVSPIIANGPLPSLKKFIDQLIYKSDAAICDFQLQVKNYANFDGAHLVSQMYKKRFPAVLCTKYEQANIDEMRKYRRYIPVLLNPRELDPENLIKGFDLCIKEFDNIFTIQRKPWRTLIRVEERDLDNGDIYVIIPAWDSDQVIKLNRQDLPSELIKKLDKNIRFHALVNIGAEFNQDIYFENWEVD